MGISYSYFYCQQSAACLQSKYLHAAIMAYSSSNTSLVFNPDYFRKQALAFNAATMDRKKWLQKQLINLEYAVYQNQLAIQDLINEGAKLDGFSDAGKWLQAVGGVALVIPNVWVQAAGAIVSIAGAIVNAAEKKKDSKALAQLSQKAYKIQLETAQIKAYYDKYTAELQKINLMPVLLFGTAAYIIYNR
jgi:hypothetical protein